MGGFVIRITVRHGITAMDRLETIYAKQAGSLGLLACQVRRHALQQRFVVKENVNLLLNDTATYDLAQHRLDVPYLWHSTDGEPTERRNDWLLSRQDEDDRDSFNICGYSLDIHFFNVKSSITYTEIQPA